MKSARFFFFVLLFSVFFVSKVLATSVGDIVINEVEYNPIQSGDDYSYEWFELYNKTGSTIVLTNWTIADNNTAKILPTITIPALDFAVVAASSNILVNYSALTGNIYYISGGKIGNGLANAGDRLILKDENGVIIDQTSWGSDKTAFDPSAKAVTDGHSIERSPFGLDTNTAADFIDQSAPSPLIGFVPPTPTPTLTPTPTPTPTPTATPTATPVPTATPTPANTRQIDFSVPSNVVIGQSFDTSISLSSFNANTLYYIKALIGKDLSSLTDGRTLGSDGVTWLAWNASWNKMPSVQTDNAGSATVKISVKTDDGIEPGNYQMVIRVKEANGTESVDSGARMISVSAPASSSASTATPVPTPKPTSSSSKSSAAKIQGSIKTIKQLSDGSAIETEGLVSVPFGVLGSDYFYIDDGASGIMVKSKNKIDLILGQRVRVSSTIEESYAERYIKTNDITIINNSNNPPIPKSARGNQIGEDLEGKLISVSGRIFETSGKTFWINDGFGDIKIYIKDSTAIKIARKKVGDYVRIIGILSQWGFDDDEKPNYRLLPRFQSDVLISSAPIGGVGQILGVATLPKTGTSLSELPGAIWGILRSHLLLKGLTFIR